MPSVCTQVLLFIFYDSRSTWLQGWMEMQYKPSGGLYCKAIACACTQRPTLPSQPAKWGPGTKSHDYTAIHSYYLNCGKLQPLQAQARLCIANTSTAPATTHPPPPPPPLAISAFRSFSDALTANDSGGATPEQRPINTLQCVTGRTAEGNDWVCQQFLPRNPVRVIVLKQQPWEGIFFSVRVKGKRMPASSMAGEKLGVIYLKYIMRWLCLPYCGALWLLVQSTVRKYSGGHESYLATEVYYVVIVLLIIAKARTLPVQSTWAS